MERTPGPDRPIASPCAPPQQPARIRADAQPVIAFTTAAGCGMALANFARMPIAKQLVADIQAFAERKPNNTKSVNALLDAVRRIDNQFTGEQRDELLRQARRTFLRQIETLENSERTAAALEKLKQNQRELGEALKRLAYKRPEGVTLH